MEVRRVAKSSAIKSLAAGVLGGALVLGGQTVYNQVNPSTSSTGTTVTQTPSKSADTKTENVTYNVESDVTKAIEKVDGAVVSIINYQEAQSSSLDDWFGGFGGSQQEDNQSSGELEEYGEGSGVIYKKADGKAYIVTNNHVVEGAKSLDVMLSTGDKVEAKLVGTDTYSDLAVLTISDAKVTEVASFGDSSALKVGEPAIAIGSPLGSEYANSATEGIVSALSRNVVMQNDNGDTVNVNAIQTDAAINPGNSGGALINIAGQVIGINSSKIASTTGDSSGTSVEGMGFAIPANDVVDIINKLEKDGQVIRPALGVQMIDLSQIPSNYLDSDLKLPDDVTSGVVIMEVQSGMPAEKAGLKKYDVITKLGDTDVSTSVELQSALYKYSVGDTIQVTYYRDGKKETASVKLTEKSSQLNFDDDSTSSSSSDSSRNSNR
jgi:serine protease Do